MKKYQIGIVGYGDFTRLMLEHLCPYADIVVSSRSKTSGDAGFGAKFDSLETVLAMPIIIPSIPAQYFEDVFTLNSRLVNPHATVVDVCSVKVKPLQTLERLLPKSCQIIGMHPMFGPSSVQRNGGLKDLRCAVCVVRAEVDTIESLNTLLKTNLGLRVIAMSAEQHDKETAYVMGLSHYIGRVMSEMNIPESELSTLAYEDLMDMKMIQGSDSWDLFQSIISENEFMDEVRSEFRRACDRLDNRLV